MYTYNYDEKQFREKKILIKRYIISMMVMLTKKKYQNELRRKMKVNRIRSYTE